MAIDTIDRGLRTQYGEQDHRGRDLNEESMLDKRANYGHFRARNSWCINANRLVPFFLPHHHTIDTIDSLQQR